MTGGIAVAKRKPSKREESSEEQSIHVRASAEFKRWLKEYAESRNRDMSGALIEAVIGEAEARGFRPAPKR